MKAIVVDDSNVIRMVVRKFLLASGFATVLEGKNGRDALAQLEGGEVPQLAVLDWNMPVMDGAELLAALRATPALEGMAIVMLTTEADGIRAAALAGGATACLAKPFTAEKLSSELRRIGFALSSPATT